MRELTDEERDDAIDRSHEAQDDVADMSKAFEEFLRTRRDHRDGLTARQQLWCAFEAGGQYVLARLKIGR